MPVNGYRTHYENLQVVATASTEVIKGAYRYLSQKWHPDKNPDKRAEAERITKIINEAYEVLSDPDRRRAHDEWIAAMRSEEQNSAHEKTNSNSESSADASGTQQSHKTSSNEINLTPLVRKEMTDKISSHNALIIALFAGAVWLVLVAIFDSKEFEQLKWLGLPVGFIAFSLKTSLTKKSLGRISDHDLQYKFGEVLTAKSKRSEVIWSVIIVGAVALYYVGKKVDGGSGAKTEASSTSADADEKALNTANAKEDGRPAASAKNDSVVIGPGQYATSDFKIKYRADVHFSYRLSSGNPIDIYVAPASEAKAVETTLRRVNQNGFKYFKSLSVEQLDNAYSSKTETLYPGDYTMFIVAQPRSTNNGESSVSWTMTTN